MVDAPRNDSGYAPKPDSSPEVKKNKKGSRGFAGAVKTWLGMFPIIPTTMIADWWFRHARRLRLKVVLSIYFSASQH